MSSFASFTCSILLLSSQKVPASERWFPIHIEGDYADTGIRIYCM